MCVNTSELTDILCEYESMEPLTDEHFLSDCQTALLHIEPHVIYL